MRTEDTILVKKKTLKRYIDASVKKQMRKFYDAQVKEVQNSIEQDVKKLNQIDIPDSKFKQLKQKVIKAYLKLKEALKQPIMKKYYIALSITGLFTAITGLAYFLTERRNKRNWEHNSQVIRQMGDRARDLAESLNNKCDILQETIDRIEKSQAQAEFRENPPFGGPGPREDF